MFNIDDIVSLKESRIQYRIAEINIDRTGIKYKLESSDDTLLNVTEDRLVKLDVISVSLVRPELEKLFRVLGCINRAEWNEFVDIAVSRRYVTEEYKITCEENDYLYAVYCDIESALKK